MGQFSRARSGDASVAEERQDQPPLRQLLHQLLIVVSHQLADLRPLALNRAVETRNFTAGPSFNEILLAELSTDPRWDQLLRKAGLKD